MFIKQFEKKLNKEINNKIKSGFLKEGYFTTWRFNRGNEVHGRIQALIIKVCFDLGFDVEVERTFFYKYNEKSKRFKPDVSIYKKGKLFAFIEYESTNSSDARFYDPKRNTCVLRNLKRYSLFHLENDPLPGEWVIISTLPKNAVKKEDWESGDGYHKSDKEFKELIKNPFEFYFPMYIKETKRMLKSLKAKGIQKQPRVSLLNINKNKIILERRI